MDWCNHSLSHVNCIPLLTPPHSRLILTLRMVCAGSENDLCQRVWCFWGTYSGDSLLVWHRSNPLSSGFWGSPSLYISNCAHKGVNTYVGQLPLFFLVWPLLSHQQLSAKSLTFFGQAISGLPANCSKLQQGLFSLVVGQWARTTLWCLTSSRGRWPTGWTASCLDLHWWVLMRISSCSWRLSWAPINICMPGEGNVVVSLN